MPTLSVVLPNYNDAQFLPHAVASFQNQSHPPDEIVIVDDASTDRSVEVVEGLRERDPRIRLIRLDQNLGTTGALNAGIRAASGDYFKPAAADDVAWPGSFERAMGILQQYPEAAFCAGDCLWLDTGSGVVHPTRMYWGEAGYCSPAEAVKAFQCCWLAFATPVMHRERTLAIGGFPEEFRWHCDFFSLYGLAFRHGFCRVPDYQALFRARTDSYSGRGMKNSDQQRAIVRKIMEKVLSREWEGEFDCFVRSGVFGHFASTCVEVLRAYPQMVDERSRRILSEMDSPEVCMGRRNYMARREKGDAKAVSRVEELMGEVGRLTTSGSLPEAVCAVDAVRAAHPEFHSLHALSSDLQLALGKPEKAAAAFYQALLLAPMERNYQEKATTVLNRLSQESSWHFLIRGSLEYARSLSDRCSA